MYKFALKDARGLVLEVKTFKTRAAAKGWFTKLLNKYPSLDQFGGGLVYEELGNLPSEGSE
jgi:hypothetical protein